MMELCEGKSYITYGRQITAPIVKKEDRYFYQIPANKDGVEHSCSHMGFVNPLTNQHYEGYIKVKVTPNDLHSVYNVEDKNLEKGNVYFLTEPRDCWVRRNEESVEQNGQ